jgi:hypothetical protein
MTEQQLQQVEWLAQEDERWQPEALEERIAMLRAAGFSILGCIRYVMVNQQTGLGFAKDIVINSKAWADKKNEFLAHQEEMYYEFVSAEAEDKQEIRNAFTLDGTKVIVRKGVELT